MDKDELIELWKTDEEAKAMFQRSKDLNDKVMTLTKEIRLIDYEVIDKLESGYRGYRSARFSKTLDDITDILVKRKDIKKKRDELLDELHEITSTLMSWL